MTDDEYIEEQITRLPHCPIDGSLMRIAMISNKPPHVWQILECSCGYSEQIEYKKPSVFSAVCNEIKDFISWAHEDKLRQLLMVCSLVALVLSISALILSFTA